MSSLGFIGLGTMGGEMATHLLAANHDLTVYDIDADAVAPLEAAGADSADTPAMVARHADVVFLSLPTPDVVRDIIFGEDGHAVGLTSGTVVVDTTTSTPETTNDIAEALADQGATVLGAPVSGGASGAEAGTLTVMVGGDRATFQECKPLFRTFADDLFLSTSSQVQVMR